MTKRGVGAYKKEYTLSPQREYVNSKLNCKSFLEEQISVMRVRPSEL